MRSLYLPILLTTLVLTGCATGPGYDSERYRTSVIPAQVSSDSGRYQGGEVLWGGILVGISNFENSTQLEVLGYPLRSNQQPNTNASPTGRFLVEKEGYLEPVDYSQGRLVTVTGKLIKTQEGQVGSADYVFPVLHPDQIHLWSKDSGSSGPVWHFGVGVGIGL